MIEHPFLVGKGLSLRGLEEEDLPQITRWINDERVRRTLTVVFPLSIGQEREWLAGLRRHPPSNIILAIVLEEGGRYIGNTGLHEIHWVDRVATTGTMIGEVGCWGKGYATQAKTLMLRYAFTTLGMERVQSEVMAGNIGSIMHLKKNGFREEGVRRSAVFRNGERHDMLQFAILRSEWLARMQVTA